MAASFFKPYLVRIFRVSVSSFCEVCSAVASSISWARCLPVVTTESGPGGGVLPYMGHIGMCRCEGYGFQAVYSSIGYINLSFGSTIGYHFHETDQLVEDFI